MPKRAKFIPGQIYHIYNRGVDKRKIFLDEEDYLRAIHGFFEFNDGTPSLNVGYFFSQNPYIDSRNQYIERKRQPRKLLVKILAFCLMPNHFHLLLQPLSEEGLTLFMRKSGTGYANYFNQKYERSGALFQGRFKSVSITQDSHFIHLPFYIHLNPLDLVTPEWRKREIKDYKKALKFLESYRWSSYLDYIGKMNFPSVTQRDFLSEFFGGPGDYKKRMAQWLREASFAEMENVALE